MTSESTSSSTVAQPAVVRGTRSFAATAIALFLVSLCLRPQLVGASALVPSIQADLGMSHAIVGLLGTIPVLCMGVFALVAPVLAARIGTTGAVALAVALVGGFGLLRAGAPDGAVLVALTFGVGAGMGIGGALLPVVVRERTAGRPLAGTVAYSAGLQLGSAGSAALAVPVALALGGWRMSLGVVSAATLLLLVPWRLFLTSPGPGSGRVIVADLRLRDARGLLLGLVFALFGIVYYGLIAWLPDAYVEHGWTPEASGAVVGALNAASLVGVLTVGAIAGRLASASAVSVALAAAFAMAAIGFLVLPDVALVWALVAGYANGALFPLILALPLRLAADASAVAGRSAVMLGLGYSIAAISPTGLGAIRDATGDFRASLLAVAVAAVGFALALAAVLRTPDQLLRR